LTKIKEEISFIERTIIGFDEAKFLSDEVAQHAICMSLITIGECANHLSDEFIGRHTEIPWVEIIAVRNISAHSYWQLDMKQIWKAIVEDIPALKNFIITQT
jgi:uncharacterized protein with HEPN domain